MKSFIKNKNNNFINNNFINTKVIFTCVILILLICLVHYYFNYYKPWLIIENFESREENIKAFYINLEKNTRRKDDLLQSYHNSDINELGLTRFPAILGKTVDVNLWLRPEAIEELEETEKTHGRTHHYQLTYGGVGCFLSHYTLAKQLLNDSEAKYYLIFEDDISFQKNMIKPINYYLSNAPEDWDIIHFTNLRKVNYTTHDQFYKPNGFWGMQAYIINKKGIITMIFDSVMATKHISIALKSLKNKIHEI